MSSSIYDGFRILNATYKVVNGVPVNASVLIPNNATLGSHAIAVNLHGGYLVAGDRLIPSFFPLWLLLIALAHNAIIISADYRLLPTPNGLTDITTDMRDFWSWLHGGNSLKSLFAKELPGHHLDLSHLLIHGGSAGGYAATQIGLDHPNEVNLLSAFYPMTDLDSSFWVDGAPQTQDPPLHLPPSSIPSKQDIEAQIVKDQADADKGKVVTEADMDRFAFAAGVEWRGLFWKLFDPKRTIGRDELPMRRLQHGAKVPKALWVAHGTSDVVVPVSDSQNFVKKVKKTQKARTEVLYDEIQGADHGFDGAWDLNSDWVKERLAWVVKKWLGKKH